MTIDSFTDEMSTQSESIIDFMNRVEVTRGEDDIIETDPAIIAHFNPRGLGKNPYFTYKGLYVCAHGDRKKVEQILEETLEAKMHGVSQR